jgi:glycerol kinase
MKEPLILAIDQGTTNSKVSVVDPTGQVVREISRPVQIRYPQPGWVEQEPVELWGTVRAAVQEALQGCDAASFSAVAITNQRESVLIWERSNGKPLGPCATWQCRRSNPLIVQLRERGLE